MRRIALPPITTVLLDIDGTLIDSNSAHAYAWFEALSEVGRSMPYARIRALIGMGGDQLLPALDPHLSPSAEPGKSAAARQQRIYKERYLASVRPMPGSRELLLALKERSIQCVVATSASNDDVDSALAIADIAGLIDARATADDAARSKPAPDIVQAALLKSRASIGSSVLLGDTRFDILAAHAAGIPAIALRCGGTPDDELADAAAIFETPLDLLKAFETSSLRELTSISSTEASAPPEPACRFLGGRR